MSAESTEKHRDQRWRIIGASRETGRDCEFLLEAPTPTAAEERANRMGVMVEQIMADGPQPPPSTAPRFTAEQLATLVPRSAPERLWHPGVAMLLSLIIPGAGQLYKTDLLEGIILGLLTWFCYLTGVAGIMQPYNTGLGGFLLWGFLLHLLTITMAGMGDPYARPRKRT